MAIFRSLPEDFARSDLEHAPGPWRGGIPGLLLVLGGLTAAGFAGFDRLNRVEVVITNPTGLTIRRVQFFRGTSIAEVGPIGPGERRRASFRLRGAGPIEGSVLVQRPMSPDSGYNLKLAEPWQAGDRLALEFDGTAVRVSRDSP